MTRVTGASQLDVSAYMPHNERYTRAHVIDGTIVRNQLSELGKLVLDPKSVVVVEEGNLLYGFSSKVQKYVGMLKGRVLSREPEVRSLVKLLLETQDREVGERAWEVLNALKKIDPTIEAVNFSNKRHLEGFSKFRNIRVRTLIQPYRAVGMQGVDHPFWHIKEVVVGARSGWYFDNLEDVASIEGFKATKSEPPLKIKWLRDPVLILESGKVIVPCRMRIDDIEVVNLFYGRIDSMMSRVAESGTSQELLQYKGVKEAPFYFEGGNLLPAMNQKGEVVYLSGVTNLLFSALNAHFLFRSEEAKRQLQQEMEWLSRSFSDLLMVEMNLERAGLLNDVAQSAKGMCARIFLASVNYFAKQMEETLEAKVVSLGAFLQPLPEYHLDLFMLPAPGGIVFLHDYDLSREVLLTISSTHKLTLEEQGRMRLYMTLVNKKQRRYGVLLKGIRQQLERAHFKVMPMTGFFDVNLERNAVSFSNAIMGTTEKGSYCITNGSSHPFDRYLRKAFADQLYKGGISRVYFTGKATPLNDVWRSITPANDYSEADLALLGHGGIHCRTQPVNSLLTTFPTLTPGAIPTPFNEETVQRSLPEFFKEMLAIID